MSRIEFRMLGLGNTLIKMREHFIYKNKAKQSHKEEKGSEIMISHICLYGAAT